MPAPTLHPVAEQVYRLLPDYMQSADPDTDWTLARFTGAAAVGLERPNEFLTLVDPDTSVTGTCELVNAAAVPRAYLAWLGWLVGVDTSVIPDADVRDAVVNAATTQRRGSLGAMATAVQRTLTGSKTVWIYNNLSGIDPYVVTVVTLSAETPDAPAALTAAWAEKPAGVDLDMQTVSGAIWANATATYATWNAVVAAKATWTALVTAIP